MFKKIDHVEILPSDMERSLKFYKEVLGFKEAWRFNPVHPQICEIVFIELGGTQIELFSYKEGIKPYNHQDGEVGYTRIGLLVDDIYEAIEYLRSKGVEISAEPRATEEDLKIAEFKDPDGIAIELIER
jgi:catechol 2,3-dioxygenase-like lactoylglutathione lyase family enzyme